MMSTLALVLVFTAACTAAPVPQQKAPVFEGEAVLPSGEFTKLSLSDSMKDGKWTVLFFFPKAFTFVCPTEILAFSSKASEFATIGANVVAASVDSSHALRAWAYTPRDKGGIAGVEIPLLSDISHQISKDYGVLIETGADAGVALRGLFIIDPTGTVRHTSVNDLPVGRSVDEVLRLTKAFQFADKHGEVCPAAWKQEGDLTIKPDPEGSLEYFKKADL